MDNETLLADTWIESEQACDEDFEENPYGYYGV